MRAQLQPAREPVAQATLQRRRRDKTAVERPPPRSYNHRGATGAVRLPRQSGDGSWFQRHIECLAGELALGLLLFATICEH